MGYFALVILLSLGLNTPALESGYTGIFMPVTQKVHQSVDAKDNTKRIILEKAESALKKHFDPDTYRFRLSARWIPRKVLRLEPKKIKAVELQGRIERYTNFQVICQARGTRHKVQVQLAVKMEQKVPVTNRRIISGETVAKEDFNFQWSAVSRIDDRLISKIDRLAGKTVRTTLLPGQPVRKSDVSTEYLIEAGDTVTLKFEKQGISVELAAEARQSGAKGDEIKIYSDETRRKYLGKVIGPGVAQWKKTL